MNTHHNITLSSSSGISFRFQATGNDPVCTSQEHLKYARFVGFAPTQEYLDLLSTHFPNLEVLVCTDKGFRPRYTNDRQAAIFKFDLTGFKKIKAIPVEY